MDFSGLRGSMALAPQDVFKWFFDLEIVPSTLIPLELTRRLPILHIHVSRVQSSRTSTHREVTGKSNGGNSSPSLGLLH